MKYNKIKIPQFHTYHNEQLHYRDRFCGYSPVDGLYIIFAITIDTENRKRTVRDTWKQVYRGVLDEV